VAAPATALNPFLPAGSGVPESAPEPAEIRAEMTEITPELAREWIRRHEAVVSANRVENGGKARDNRQLRRDDVAGYARDIRAGNWSRNGETLKIARDGTVADGQHRLYACMQAGKPFWSIVVTGVDPEAQDTIDTGIKRRLSDQLSIGGERNATILASVARWSLRWLHGVRVGGGGAGYTPTHTEMLEYIAAEPRLRDAADYAMRARGQFKPVRVSVAAMAWMLLHGVDGLAAEVFLERVADGADLHSRHPVLTLRERLTNAKVSDERLTEHEQLALFCLAWNAWREGRELSRMQLPKGGLTPKNFPEPK
jgi:hypothetical protein